MGTVKVRFDIFNQEGMKKAVSKEDPEISDFKFSELTRCETLFLQLSSKEGL